MTHISCYWFYSRRLKYKVYCKIKQYLNNINVIEIWNYYEKQINNNNIKLYSIYKI